MNDLNWKWNWPPASITHPWRRFYLLKWNISWWRYIGVPWLTNCDSFTGNNMFCTRFLLHFFCSLFFVLCELILPWTSPHVNHFALAPKINTNTISTHFSYHSYWNIGRSVGFYIELENAHEKKLCVKSHFCMYILLFLFFDLQKVVVASFVTAVFCVRATILDLKGTNQKMNISSYIVICLLFQIESLIVNPDLYIWIF